MPLGENFEFKTEMMFYEEDYRYRLVTNDSFFGKMLDYEEEKINFPFTVMAGGSYHNDYFSMRIEYLYNGKGFNYDEWDSIRKEIEAQNDKWNEDKNNPLSVYNLGVLYSYIYENGSLNLCQHYIMFRISNPEANNPLLSLTSVVNLSDLSGIEMIKFSYRDNNYLRFSGLFSITYGNPVSEFKLFMQDWCVNFLTEILI